MSQTLSVEMVSDFVCPWCYVGKKRLEKALRLLADRGADITVELVWQPFQLSPDMPRAGRRRADHYREIFGAERAQQIMDSMRDTGLDEGIAFGNSPDAMSPNTLAAHALLLWAAETPGVDCDAVAEALFSAHHEACADIGDPEVLAGIAAAAGMDGAAVRRKLAAGEDEARVQALIRQSVERGVSGVPFFIVNNRYGLSGAQPPELLVQAFEQIAADEGGRTLRA